MLAPPPTRRRWFQFCLATVYVLFAICAIWSIRREQMIPFPEDSNVEEILATARKTDSSINLPAVPELSIPARYIPRVLAIFRPAIKSDWVAAPSDPPVVDLTIITKDGATIPITVYFTGQNPLSFNINGVMGNRRGKYSHCRISKDGKDKYFLWESVALVQFLVGIEGELSTGVEDQKAREQLEDLERSIGVRPPRLDEDVADDSTTGPTNCR